MADYLSIKEVAKKLQLSPVTIRLWIKTKGLPCIKLGSRLRFDEEAVDRWVQQYRKGGDDDEDAVR